MPVTMREAAPRVISHARLLASRASGRLSSLNAACASESSQMHMIVSTMPRVRQAAGCVIALRYRSARQRGSALVGNVAVRGKHSSPMEVSNLSSLVAIEALRAAREKGIDLGIAGKGKPEAVCDDA